VRERKGQVRRLPVPKAMRLAPALSWMRLGPGPGGRPIRGRSLILLNQ
jgi:hypothetical protein